MTETINKKRNHIIICSLLSLSISSCSVPVAISDNIQDKDTNQINSDNKSENKILPDKKESTPDSGNLNTVKENENTKETKSSDTNINASTQQSGEASVVNQNNSSVSTGRSTTNNNVNQNNHDNRDDIPPIPDDIVYNETIVNDESIQKRLEDSKPHVRFDVNDPIPDNIKNGYIDLVFKDEFEIRYYRDKKEFISRTGADLSKVNKLVNDFNITDIGGIYLFSDESDEKMADIEEKYKLDEEKSENLHGYDIPNMLSVFTLYSDNGEDIKLIIEELRKLNLVLSCNYAGEPVKIGD